MASYIVRRIMLFIPVLIVVGVIVFLLIRFIPGCPARVMLGEFATEEQVEELRSDLGLDRPVPVQFAMWVSNISKGDFGRSIFFNDSVLNVVYRHLGPSFSIVLVAMLISIIIAVPVGIISAIHRGTWLDSSLIGTTFLGVSMPSFWTGMILVMIFGIWLRWFPTSGYTPIAEGFIPWFRSIILPAIAIGFTQVGVKARMVRDSMIDILGDDFIRTARAKGVGFYRILMRHAFPNTLVPLLTLIGNGFALLMAGGVIVETAFNINGLGWLTVNAVFRRDFPLVQGSMLCIALIYSAINLLVDISYAIVDPRIRLE